MQLRETKIKNSNWGCKLTRYLLCLWCSQRRPVRSMDVCGMLCGDLWFAPPSKHGVSTNARYWTLHFTNFVLHSTNARSFVCWIDIFLIILKIQIKSNTLLHINKAIPMRHLAWITRTHWTYLMARGPECTGGRGGLIIGHIYGNLE